MNVLVVPEDFTKDQYILKPIIRAMMAELGRPSTVRVCQEPRLRGISQALRWERIEEILERYRGMVDLFLLCVDRDGDAGRRAALNSLEARARTILSDRRMFLAENAWQEIEVWVLAGHDLPTEWSWQDVRAATDAKERYFHPFAALRGFLDAPGEGRKMLAEQAAGRYRRIRRLCREDVAELERRIGASLATLP